MHRAFDIIPRILRSRGLQTHAHASHAVLLAQEWLSTHLPSLKDDLQVHSLKDGVLLVHCRHSIAQQECRQVSPDLLHFLHTEAGCRDILSIQPIRSFA